MQIPEKIQNAVLSGKVLDDNGAWVPIADMLAKEKEFMRHLQNGEVIIDDQWVTIETARSISEKLPNAAAGTDQVTPLQ